MFTLDWDSHDSLHTCVHESGPSRADVLSGNSLCVCGWVEYPWVLYGRVCVCVCSSGVWVCLPFSVWVWWGSVMRTCVCVYIFFRVYVSVCLQHRSVHVCSVLTHRWIIVCMHAIVHAHICIIVCGCVYRWVHECVCVCIFKYTRVYDCVCAYVTTLVFLSATSSFCFTLSSIYCLRCCLTTGSHWCQ